jgi:TusA-related sulfurtransferase
VYGAGNTKIPVILSIEGWWMKDSGPWRMRPEQRHLDPVIFKDLRGVTCPMNFVKTKVELSRMQIGDHLKILLDDGEPIDNVPRSVITEGHEIISQERLDGHWQVVIEKKI